MDGQENTENKKRGFLEKLAFIIFFLFLRIETWLCSLPMWITLILHFTTGLPLYWFFITLGIWILIGVIRLLVLKFARWGRVSTVDEKKNINPYSKTNDDYLKR